MAKKKKNLTPLYVRDKLVECFINANKRTIAEQAKKLGKEISDKDVERQLKANVKKAFKLVKEDFSNPRKESFPKVLALLSHRCKSSKKEKEVMKNVHKMMALVKKL